MKKAILSFILLSAPAFSYAASVNLLVNGDFEQTGPNTGQWAVYKTIPGWTTISGPGIEIRDNVVGTTNFGSQFVELDSHGALDTNSAMQQLISTVAGQEYSLSFYYSPRINQSSATNGISVFWNNKLLQDITATGGSANIWTFHQFMVLGTGSNDSLVFAATGIDDSLGGNIDNVSLNAVPVPAAAWLFASALGLFGFSNRRKSA